MEKGGEETDRDLPRLLIASLSLSLSLEPPFRSLLCPRTRWAFKTGLYEVGGGGESVRVHVTGGVDVRVVSPHVAVD